MYRPTMFSEGEDVVWREFKAYTLSKADRSKIEPFLRIWGTHDQIRQIGWQNLNECSFEFFLGIWVQNETR